MPRKLVRIPLPGTVPAERAVLLVAGDDRPFALCGAWAGSRAIVGSRPTRTAPPFTALAEGRPDFHPDTGGQPGQPEESVTEVIGGGWFGVLPFPLGREVERTGPPPPRPTPSPPSLMRFHDHVLRLDAKGQWWFEALWTEERAGELRQRREELAARLARGVGEAGEVETSAWRSVPGAEGHAAAVQTARERIIAGDLFQANLTIRLESELREGSPAEVFVRGVEALRPDRAAFVGREGGAVISLSPELFVERKGRTVRSAPIKGTAADEKTLRASAKDKAENVMIVDLVRNDLGRVCVPGTITVPALADPRPHTGVWHLVSEVEGTLRDDATDADLVRAAFPPGSVTGAPKVAALDVIAELESTGREAYTGAIGFASPVAGLELNVAIRTFEVDGERIWLGVGGGIVADSDPRAEAAEAATKAAPLLAAIGATLAPPRRRPRSAPSPLRRGPRPIPRPDPAQGVFETILARDGEAQRLDDHLTRMTASLTELFDAALPGETRNLVERAAAEIGDGRVRLDARPDGTLLIETGALRARATSILTPVCVPGGLGPHKWADRRLLEALGEGALLVDLDGLVLEAAYANVVIVEGEELVTPPRDGRILPGVGLAALAAREEPIDLDRLARADAVLRGVWAVRGELPLLTSAGSRPPLR
jgi:para-aminobenzoate synthetase/4-amino-4-deoxychorismate lyase